MSNHFIGSVVAAILASGLMVEAASAGPVYKCLDSKGVAAYQQEPCPKSSKQASHGYAPTVAPASQLGWAAQAGSLAQQQRVREAYYDKEKPRTVAATPSRQLSQAPVVEPNPRREMQITRSSDLGSTKIDQFGSPYTKVAPNVLIDQKTSRPCITNGNNEIVMCQ